MVPFMYILNFYEVMKTKEIKGNQAKTFFTIIQDENGFVLTYLVVYLKCNVKLQDDHNKLEPRAHLLVRQRNVDGKHNVVGLNLLGHGVVKALDLVTLVRTPRHEPFGFRFVYLLDCVHTLDGRVIDGAGGTWSW